MRTELGYYFCRVYFLCKENSENNTMTILKSTLLLIAAFFTMTMSAQEPLVIKGQIDQEFADYDLYTLEVVTLEGEIHEIPHTRNGKYHVIAYSGDRYAFNFKLDGQLMKCVTIDARVPAEVEAYGLIKFDVEITELSALMLEDTNTITLRYNEETGTVEAVSNKTSVFTADLRVR